MEKTKYYTPAQEDIRMGFVYERQDSIMTDMWRPRTITEWGHIFYVLSDISDGGYRVPYLTAEQIEAEGWKVTSSSESGRQFEAHLIRDQKIKLYTYNGPANQLIVYHSSTMVFRGICRCINDLRTVCKLLGI